MALGGYWSVFNWMVYPYFVSSCHYCVFDPYYSGSQSVGLIIILYHRHRVPNRSADTWLAIVGQNGILKTIIPLNDGFFVIKKDRHYIVVTAENSLPGGPPA